MRYFFAIGFAVLTAAAVSFGRSDVDIAELPASLKALAAADKVILFSIDGRYLEPGSLPKTAEKFGDYPILGKLELGKEARAVVVGALASGLNNDEPAKCFEPRHVLRATKGKTHVDFVICFKCNQTYVYENGKRTDLRISKGSQPALDKLLKDAKIPLAPQ